MKQSASGARFLIAIFGFAFAALAAGPAISSNLKLSGILGYSYTGSTANITAARIDNLDVAGTSGTIRLELWAFPSPFTGTQSGYKMAQYQLGQLTAGYYYSNVNSGTVAFAPPPDGTWTFTLLLTEYTSASSNQGFTYTDWWNFSTPETFGTPSSSPTVLVVEYHHSGFDHYFITPLAVEIALLDAHAPPFELWSRTGLSFNAYANATAPSGSVAICRFFNDHFAPKSSHFYAPHGLGCEGTIANFPDWLLESDSLFNAMLPDSTNGACPAGTIPVYRLYNNGMGAAPNHRFVTDLAERQKMLAMGYIAEGAGIGVGMCVPPASGGNASAQGIWTGTTNTNQTVAGIVLSDGTSYFLYTPSGTSTVAGVVLGNATFISGAISATNARDFNISPYGVAFAATISGNYVQGSTINATVLEAGTTGTISLTYDSRYDQPASLAAAAGTYSASVGSLGGWQNTTLTLSSNGTIVGGGNGCTFSGAATTHGSVNVFDVQVTFNGGACLFGTSTIYGVAFYDPAIRTLYGTAPNTARTDALIFIGSK